MLKPSCGIREHNQSDTVIRVFLKERPSNTLQILKAARNFLTSVQIGTELHPGAEGKCKAEEWRIATPSDLHLTCSQSAGQSHCEKQ